MEGSSSNVEEGRGSFFQNIFRKLTPDNRQTSIENRFISSAKEIYDPSLVTLGHATDDLEHAEQILKQGLLVAHLPFSSYTADQLIDQNLPREEQESRFVTRLRKWPHKYDTHFTHMIIIQVPKSDNGDVSQSYIERFIQKLPHYEMVKGIKEEFTHILPSKYVRGFIDLQTGKFTANHNFQPSKIE